jgi:hypothetical protein
VARYGCTQTIAPLCAAAKDKNVATEPRATPALKLQQTLRQKKRCKGEDQVLPLEMVVELLPFKTRYPSRPEVWVARFVTFLLPG